MSLFFILLDWVLSRQPLYSTQMITIDVDLGHLAEVMFVLPVPLPCRALWKDVPVYGPPLQVESYAPLLEGGGS